jgi:hypothetical protein
LASIAAGKRSFIHFFLERNEEKFFLGMDRLPLISHPTVTIEWIIPLL